MVKALDISKNLTRIQIGLHLGLASFVKFSMIWKSTGVSVRRLGPDPNGYDSIETSRGSLLTKRATTKVSHVPTTRDGSHPVLQHKSF
jgi:hypothetical protein